MKSTKYMGRYYNNCGKWDKKRNERLFAACFGSAAFGLLLLLTVLFPPVV